MPRSLLTAVLSALVAIAVVLPITGATAATGIVPCDAPTLEGAEPFTDEGASATLAPSATPAFGHDILAEVDPTSTYSEESVTSAVYQFDLSGLAVDGEGPDRATLDINLDWDDDLSDFDMYIKDADGNQFAEGASNTIFKEYVDGGSGEQATFTVTHCQEFEIEIVNYSGNPAAALQLDLFVSRVR